MATNAADLPGSRGWYASERGRWPDTGGQGTAIAPVRRIEATWSDVYGVLLVARRGAAAACVSDLVHDLPPHREVTVAFPAGVTARACAVPAPSAYETLRLVVAETTTRFNVRSSVRWLLEVAELADEIVGEGRVLPDVLRDDGLTHVAWTPVLSASDLQRLDALTGRVPHNEFRDLGWSSRAHSKAITMGALRHLTDAATRRRLVGASVHPRCSRHADDSTAAERLAVALTEDDPFLDIDVETRTALERDLGAWQQAWLARVSAMEVGLRLEWNQRRDHPWMLRVVLRSRRDPSITFSLEEFRRNPIARELWPRGAILNDVSARLDHLPAVHRFFARDAPRSSSARRFTFIERLRAHGVARLANDDARAFLVDVASEVTADGFFVMLPRLLRGDTAATAAEDSETIRPGSGLFTLGTLGEFDWQLAVGGNDVISPGEFRQLTVLKRALLASVSESFEPDADALRHATYTFNVLTREAVAEALTRFVTREHATPSESDTRALFRAFLDAAVAELRGGGTAGVPDLSWLSGSLRPYQAAGVRWLRAMTRARLGACLADDMGLGKTIQALGLLASLRADEDRWPTTLVVCPASVLPNWEREIREHLPTVGVLVQHGARSPAGTDLARAVRYQPLVLTTYDTLCRRSDALARLPWDLVVLDEAQAIKNTATRRSKAARGLHAAQRIALSGTPIENHVSELWALSEFLNPGLLGTSAAFTRRFDNAGDARYGELRADTSLFLLRREKTDKSIVPDLPDKIEMKSYCRLTPAQATSYQAIVDVMLAKVRASDGLERRGLILTTLQKLKQVCDHPSLLGDQQALGIDASGKLERVGEILDAAFTRGEKVLCFTQWIRMGHLLQRFMSERFGQRVEFLHGGLTTQERTRVCERLMNDQATHALILQLKAGGVGINLQRANHVIHVDRWWNAAVENQATDRAHRIGQKNVVEVHKLISRGTVEERIDELIDQKAELAARIISARDDAAFTELSDDELADMIRLRENWR